MGLPVKKNRVEETTVTTGTGAVNLAGAVAGFQSFATAFADGEVVFYCINGGSEWEVGIGTFNEVAGTLSRDTVLDSSNAGALVSFSAGSKNVKCTLPAERIGINLSTLFTFAGETGQTFTIPPGVKRVTGTLVGFKTNNTSVPVVRIGGTGGIESTGYTANGGTLSTSAQSVVANSTGFPLISSNSAANIYHGAFTLDVHDPATNTWVFGMDMMLSNSAAKLLGAGSKAITGELSELRITTAGGTNLIESGSVLLRFEF